MKTYRLLLAAALAIYPVASCSAGSGSSPLPATGHGSSGGGSGGSSGGSGSGSGGGDDTTAPDATLGDDSSVPTDGGVIMRAPTSDSSCAPLNSTQTQFVNLAPS